MPDDELLDESGVPEDEPSVSDEHSQEQGPSSDSSTDEVIEDSNDGDMPDDMPDDLPDYIPDDMPDDFESEIPENEYGDYTDEPTYGDDLLSGDESLEGGSSVSANEIDYEQIQMMINRSVSENNALYFSEDYVILEDLEEFESTTLLVDRYQYAVLEKLEFLQYASAIVIALLFLILFMRYKRR